LFILLLRNYFLKNKKDILAKNLFLLIIIFALPLQAHTFTGMVGFYDGISHPVLGLDHFLAMVSVGIISAQIGGRAIWSVPSTFVSFMLVGGVLSMAAEMNITSETIFENIFYEYISIIIELGIILSVILLGAAIAIDKKLSIKISMIFVSVFGLCHGLAHGLEMPWASNPILFALGFVSGTAILHLFGVGIGMFAIRSSISNFCLKLSGLGCVIYGSYLFIKLMPFYSL